MSLCVRATWSTSAMALGAARGVRSPAATALVALARVDAADLADRLPEEVSGGQAQRAAAARVLAQASRVILADEPTGRLDHATGGPGPGRGSGCR
ncbi:ATP-binding cassette domain-containing protein [Streptomyces sp. NPDC004227]